MKPQPQVSIIFLYSDHLNKPAFESIRQELETDRRAILEKLSEKYSICSYWVVSTNQDLARFVSSFQSEESDIVILLYQTQVEELHVQELVDAVGNKPLVAWCYLPWKRAPKPLSYEEYLRASGAASMFVAFHEFRKRFVPYLPVFGAIQDTDLLRKLDSFVQSARVRSQLRHAKIAVLEHVGIHTEEISQTVQSLGVNLQRIPFSEYQDEVAKVSNKEIDEYIQQLREHVPDLMVTIPTLQLGANLSVALNRLALQKNLDVFALPAHSPEIRRVLKICPGLPPEWGDNPHTIYLTTLDPGAILASLLLRLVTGQVGFLFKAWFWDKARNILVGGHTGLQYPNISAPKLSLVCGDYYCNRADPDGGVQLEFIARSGRVTLLQMEHHPEGWKALITSGMCLESELWVEGLPQAVIRPDCTIDHYLEVVSAKGSGRNWVMVYGSIMEDLIALFELMQMPFDIIQQ